ncbi:MAG: hypothetical protein HY898_02985 [Deltaproteobacteria bacterium]|nr:hypothetical protein [Deltaproteobacteria bacterium]
MASILRLGILVGATALLQVACGGTVELTNETLNSTGGSAGAGGSAGVGGASGQGGSAGSSAKGGAAGQAGSGGTAGKAGAAGFDCQGLVQVGDTLEVQGDSYKSQLNPLLSFASDDGNQVALGLMEQPDEGPSYPPVQLHIAALKSWSPWPSKSLSAPPQAPFVVGPELVRIAKGAADGQLAVAYPGTPSPPASQPTTVFYNPAVSVDTASSSVNNTALESAGQTQRASFVTRAQDRWLIGHQYGFDSLWYFQLAMSAQTNPPMTLSTMVGCGTMPLVADSIPSGGGWIFGFSSSREFGTCADDNGVVTSPDTIELGYTGGPGGGYAGLPWTAKLPGDAVRYLSMTSAGDEGGWIAYAFEGLNAEVPPPLQLVRVDAAGNQIVAPTSIVDGQELYHAPALTSLRGQPLIVYALGGVPGPVTQLRLRLYAMDGAIDAMAELSATGQLTGEVAALAHPINPEVMVAWSEYAGMQRRVYLAKFACMLPD